MKRKSCLFLDRDGVINQKLPSAYVTRASDFHVLDGVPEAIRLLREKFERIVIVTNQQGVSKGLMTESDLQEVHRFMLGILADAGATIDAIYYCTELAAPDNRCRKPAIGMVLEALRDFPDICLCDSVMVGDSPADMLLGDRCGMRCVRIVSHDHYDAAVWEGIPRDVELAALSELPEALAAWDGSPSFDQEQEIKK